MTIPEITFPPPVPDGPPAPYEKAVPVKLTEDKRLNLTQLTDELSAATGHQVQVALAEIDGTRQLAVVPGNLNPKVVAKVVADHSPIEGYEIPEDEKAFAALLTQVQHGPVELTPEELQIAVVGLLRRALSAPTRHR